MDNIQLCYIDNEINKIDKMKQGDVIYKNGVELLVVLSYDHNEPCKGCFFYEDKACGSDFLLGLHLGLILISPCPCGFRWIGKVGNTQMTYLIIIRLFQLLAGNQSLQLPEYQTHQNGGVCHSVSYLNNHILSIQSPDFQ